MTLDELIAQLQRFREENAGSGDWIVVGQADVVNDPIAGGAARFTTPTHQPRVDERTGLVVVTTFRQRAKP